MSKPLMGSKTHQNLKDAFALSSQANRLYLYFAKVADVEGHPDLAALFKDAAEGKTGHANGYLDFLKSAGDPVSGLPIGNTEKNVKSAVASDTQMSETLLPEMAKTAREEGFDALAEWFETVARANRTSAGLFTKGLESLEP